MRKLMLSYSKWDTYNECSYKYFLKYKERVKPFIPVRYPLVTGVAFHELVNDMYRECSFDKTYLTRNWKRKFEECLDTESSSFTTTEDSDKYLKYGYILINKFYSFADKNGYLIKPIQSEWDFKTTFGDAEIVGKVDLIIQRKDIPYIEILDFKTGWKLPTQEEVDNNKQLTLYDWAVKKFLIGNVNTRVGLFFPRKDKIILSSRTNIEYVEALRSLNSIKKAINSDQFSPNYISCYRCEFTKECKFFNTIKK